MHLVSGSTELVVLESEVPILEPAARARGQAVRPRYWPPLHRLSREPLAHFLLAGLLLFAAASFFDHSSASTGDRIYVAAPEIQRLRDVWARQYGREPDAAQMRNLIDDYIREEILYREALASGLDKDDSIIRRRLVEKMEFLSQEVAGGDPSEAELQKFFNRNREKFQLPAQLAFSHIFFSQSRRGSSAADDARRALAVLRARSGAAGLETQFGDPFMLQSEYPLQTREEVKSLFGPEFATQVFHLASGHWEGPIPSTYGLHLVRISQYSPAHLPQLSEIRSEVVTEFKNERLQVASEAYYRRLRERYRIDVDGAALAGSESQQGASTRTGPPKQVTQADED
jgi:peptidyl-prolyl cis-trans isomerase C